MKTVLINRAVPGSGKTTFAKNIFSAVSSAGLSIANFNSYNELLDRNAVPDPARHFNYRWDERIQNVIPVSTPVKPFDYDDLIQITPETYHELKNGIGDKILKTMTSCAKSDCPCT